MYKKDEDKTLTCFLLIVLIFIVPTLSSITNGYVLTVLWEWFVVPLFLVPSLSIPYAIGLVLVVGILINRKSLVKNEKKYEETSELVAAIFADIFLIPAIFLFIGWVLTKFI